MSPGEYGQPSRLTDDVLDGGLRTGYPPVTVTPILPPLIASVVLVVACDASDVAPDSGNATGDASPTTGGAQAEASDLGLSCLTEQGFGSCSDGLECQRASPLGGIVCTKSCDTDSECPTGGLCYIFDRDDGHVCARICESDADCDADLAGGCKERTSTTPRKICVE
jgi:hypothetical protein